MMNDLKLKADDYLKERISGREFTLWYEEWYQQLDDSQQSSDLEGMFSDSGYFEENEELRKEHHAYYGDDKLKEMVSDLLSKI